MYGLYIENYIIKLLRPITVPISFFGTGDHRPGPHMEASLGNIDLGEYRPGGTWGNLRGT